MKKTNVFPLESPLEYLVKGTEFLPQTVIF